MDWLAYGYGCLTGWLATTLAVLLALVLCRSAAR